MHTSGKRRGLSLWWIVGILLYVPVMTSFCLFSSPVCAAEENIRQTTQGREGEGGEASAGLSLIKHVETIINPAVVKEEGKESAVVDESKEDPVEKGTAAGEGNAVAEASSANRKEISLQQYVPENEDEKRICNYLDWQLASYMEPVDNASAPLLLTRYTMSLQQPGSYEVVLDPFIIGTGLNAINIAPVRLVVQLEEDALAINISLPQSFTAGKRTLRAADNIVEWVPGKKGTVSIGSQRITARWVEKGRYYSSLDTDLADISITGKDTDGKAAIGSIISYGSMKVRGHDNWVGTYSLVVNDIDVADGDKGSFHLNRINVEGSGKGEDFALFQEKSRIINKIDSIDTVDDPGSMLREILSAVDTIVQLWSGSNSKMVAQGLRLSFADNKLFKIAEITGSSSLVKDHNSSDINGLSTLALKDIQIGEGDPGKEGSFTGVTLGAVSLNATGEIDKIPEKFFENNWSFLQNINEKRKNSPGQKPEGLPMEARTAIADLLGLLAGYNADFTVKDIAVFFGQQMPQVNLDSAAISYGLDTTPESGGVGSLSLGFSGLQQQMEMPFPVPKAAKISLELSKIPSLTRFITHQ